MAKMKSNDDHVGDGEEEEEELVLPGFRFHPTDEELVTFYLRRKVAKKKLSIEIIREIDIYKHEPWDLPKASTVAGEKEWYFFCLRGRKYRNSIRPNRVTGSGFWKATGIDRPIYSAVRAGDCIGLKKSLVYYRGSAGKGTKTDWMMHEFRLPLRTDIAVSSPSLQEAEVWTICRIFKRNITYKKPPHISDKAVPQPESSSNTGSLESDTGDEYMNHFPQAHSGQLHLLNGAYQQVQGQWSTVQSSPMTAVHQGVLAPVTPDELHKDGYWDEIGRMVMELTDPSAVYGCSYT